MKLLMNIELINRRKKIGLTGVLIFSILMISIFLAITLKLKTSTVDPDKNKASGLDYPFSFEIQDKKQIIPPVEGIDAQYSPWVFQDEQNNVFDIYYCKNTEINGNRTDRIWRIRKTNGTWQNDKLVLEGDPNGKDGLSCSPSVIKIGNTLHMYYITAPKDSFMELYIYHAISHDGGDTWEKLGPIGGFPQPYDGFIETPTAFLENERLVLYFIGGNGNPDSDLMRIESADYHNFNTSSQLTTGTRASHGHLHKHNGYYYYIYSVDTAKNRQPPNEFYLMISHDGIQFSEEVLIYSISSDDWDNQYIWSPHFVFEKNIPKIIYTARANLGTLGWIACGSFGELTLDITISSSFPTPATYPSYSLDCKAMDANLDGEINIADFDEFREMYLKNCIPDSQLSPNDCGLKDSDANGVVDIRDFKEFVIQYKKGSCN